MYELITFKDISRCRKWVVSLYAAYSFNFDEALKTLASEYSTG
jgi:hypothetical protein